MPDSMLSHGIPELTPVQRARAHAMWDRVWDSLLPDYETDKQGWEREMTSRLEAWANKQGFINRSTRQPLINKALQFGPDVERVWNVFIAAAEPRIEARKAEEKRQESYANIAGALKPLFIEAGLAGCLTTTDFRRIIKRFYTIEDALVWGKYFTTDYRDKPHDARDRLSFEPVILPIEQPEDVKVVAEKPVVSAQELPKVDSIQEIPMSHTESPVIVFPQRDGSIVYKEIRFAVTLREGGTFQQAVPLMEQFIANKQYIDPDCYVAPRSAAQPSEAGKSSKGDGTREHFRATGIMKVSSEDGTPQFKLPFLLKNGKQADFPYPISTKFNVKRLETALETAGYHPDQWPLGKQFPMTIDVTYMKGKEYKPGKFRTDDMQFEIIKDEEPA